MRNHRKVLHNEALDSQLWEQGYVTIPFLNNSELKTLLGVFNEIPTEHIQHFYATAHSPDLDFRKRMSEAVKTAMHRSVNEQMMACKLLGGSFIVKAPGGSDVLQPHQDWNIVDEEKHRSYNIWIPLVDLNEQNGVIMVMPGSHRWLRSFRHSSIPCAFQQVHSLVLDNMKPLYLKAGEALIYDHALLHASQPNRSNEMRIACASGVMPEEAEMLFYWNNNGTVEEYESSPDFFMLENVFTGPGGLRKRRAVAYDFHSVSENEFFELSGIQQPVLEEIKTEQETSMKQTKPSFFKVYTPANIFREIKFRLSGK